jgi:hypothetical protein
MPSRHLLRRFAGGLPALILGLVAAGCTDVGPRTYAVSGTVTLDGRPLEDGDIYFYALDPNVSADAGKIKNGKFAFRSKAGAKRVEIQASRVVPSKRTPMGGPVREQFLPARYNSATTLTAEVSPTGDNHFEFALQSDPPQPP